MFLFNWFNSILLILPLFPLFPLAIFFFFAVICDVVSSFFLISVSSMLLFSNMRTPKVTLACLSFLWSPGLSPSLSFRFPFFLVSESCFSWYLKLLYLLFCLFERRSALSFWFEFETSPPYSFVLLPFSLPVIFILFTCNLISFCCSFRFYIGINLNCKLLNSVLFSLR